MRVVVFQHQAPIGPGFLGEAFERRGARLDVVRADLGQPIPADLAQADALMVLGGTMNVYQEAEHPWLVDEDRALRAAVERGQPVLGVCLGGQMLAKAMGARVHLMSQREVGLMPIELTDDGKNDRLFAGLGPAPAFVSWHDDTFDVPAGAVRLAGSAGCANHAFRIGERAYGLQFHPEVTTAMLEGWLEHVLPETQVDRAAFRAAVAAQEDTLRERADRLIANFVG